jgi:hypothetical protein
LSAARCQQEEMLVDTEVAILKHKWDTLSNGEGEEDQQDWSEEERAEYERVNQLAEEMSAQARLAFDEESNARNAGGMRVIDYKANSRVI